MNETLEKVLKLMNTLEKMFNKPMVRKNLMDKNLLFPIEKGNQYRVSKSKDPSNIRGFMMQNPVNDMVLLIEYGGLILTTQIGIRNGKYYIQIDSKGNVITKLKDESLNVVFKMIQEFKDSVVFV